MEIRGGSSDNPWVRFRRALPALLATACAAVLSCSDDDGPTAPLPAPRTYRMGFSAIPPRPDLALLLRSLDLWTRRADAGLILSEPPWEALLAGMSPDSLVRSNQLGLVNYYRSRGLRVIVSVDPTNGLDRSSDSAPLEAMGRSLTEPAIQALFRSYVTALDTLVRPDYISVASETNLVRAAAPPALYAAVVQAAAGAAADIRAHDASVKIFTTVQVEVAWGRLPPPGAYVGIAQDRADFPFMEALGLSSYPYLGGYADPDSLPLDYYSRLVEGDPIEMLVIEGGWSSEAIALPSTPEMQRRYIGRHAEILDRAQAWAWFQISFTDLDAAAFGVPPATLEPFAHLGLVDVDLNPKPALAAWDAEYLRPGP
jgi:hypothetical protein